MNVIIKNYMCFANVWYDSEPMPLDDALLEVFNKMRRNYRRGFTDREPILVDMDGNEVIVD